MRIQNGPSLLECYEQNLLDDFACYSDVFPGFYSRCPGALIGFMCKATGEALDGPSK